MNLYHYVYRINEIDTGLKYIGVRSSNILPELDLGVHYFSSSANKQFINRQKQFPMYYTYEIINSYETRDEAIYGEYILHRLYNVKDNNNYINIVEQSLNGFNNIGLVNTTDGINNYMVSINDDRYINGDLYHVSCKTYIIDNKHYNGIRQAIIGTGLSRDKLIYRLKSKKEKYKNYIIKVGK